jgi:hypothetical protein
VGLIGCATVGVGDDDGSEAMVDGGKHRGQHAEHRSHPLAITSVSITGRRSREVDFRSNDLHAKFLQPDGPFRA